MARIAGVNIPNHQHAEIALTAIYGIGRSTARRLCASQVEGRYFQKCQRELRRKCSHATGLNPVRNGFLT